MPSQQERPLLNQPNADAASRKTKQKAAGAALVTTVTMLGLLIIALEVSNKKPSGVNPGSPTGAPATDTPAPSLPTDYVVFTVVAKEVDAQAGTTGNSNTQTCTEILADARNDLLKNPMFLAIANAVIYQPPTCTTEQLCSNPQAKIPCSKMPAIGIQTGIINCENGGNSSQPNDTASVSSGSDSSRDFTCIDVGKEPCFMGHVTQLFGGVVAGCKQVQSGNRTAVCGVNGTSTLFNTTLFESNAVDNATLTTKGFFTCRNNTQRYQQPASKHPKGKPPRSFRHR